MDFKQKDIIESYLRGDLEGSDLASFENQMQIDPAFKEEVLYEQLVKEGISEYRKAELKGRLNAIDVSSNWVGLGSFGSNTILKSIGGTLVVVVLGIVAYYNIDADDLTGHPVDHTYIDGTYLPNKDIEIPEIEIPEEEPLVTEKAFEPAGSEAREEPVEKAEPVEEAVAKSTADESERDFTPKVNLPGLADVDSEDAMKTEDLDIPEVSSLDEVGGDSQPLDVETVNRNSGTIKYKYLEGKLYLYGDFGKQPYEILEINKADERRIYVYYDSEYYQVEVTDKVEELPVITNKKLREELEILRNSKLTE